MREVTLLSQLNHKYVLRYYQAWLEESKELEEKIEQVAGGEEEEEDDDDDDDEENERLQ
jgi:translation initiation factor 2-alpha kinase 4